MKKDVVEEKVIKELNLMEKLLFRIFNKSFVKVYKLGITFGFNNK